MLHLYARIHFDEIELTVLVQELERACPPVADLLAGCNAAVANTVDEPTRNTRRRCFLDHLLVTALHGAVALAQIHRVAVFVGHDLDLDVTRVLQEFFHVHRRIAKRGARFGLGHLHRVDQRGLGMHHAHAATAATASRLDDHRVAHCFGNTADLHRIVRQFTVRTGHAGHARLDHGLLGRHLVAHGADVFGRRANKLETTLFHALGKVGVFTEKTVARVDRLGIRHLGRRDDGRHVQITQRGRRRADAHSLFGQLDVFGVAVGLGIHHHCLDAQFVAGALDTEGDFAAIGDQDLFKHVVYPQ